LRIPLLESRRPFQSQFQLESLFGNCEVLSWRVGGLCHHDFK
jgi:hypothetical protein